LGPDVDQGSWTAGHLLAARQLGKLGWQGAEAVSNLVQTRDLQLLADRHGLVPGPPCFRVVPNCMQGIAKVP